MRPGPRATSEMLRSLSDLIEQRTGIVYDPDKEDLLADKVEPLVVERGFDSFLEYRYFLQYDEQAEAEWRRLETVLAVNETYFWREVDQIEAAANILIPRLQDQKKGRPVRIWHAACGSGEEPYSMAIALAEAGRFLHGPVEIIATDVSQKALEHARTGVYRQRSFRALPLHLQKRYFEPAEQGRLRLVEAIRSRVRFERLNLVDPIRMSTMQGLDIIFCRNVFIYFSQSTIKTVAHSLYNSLNSPGYLFVAAVESLLRTNTEFDFVDVGSAFGYLKE